MKLTNCRVCRGTAFSQILDLGHTPLADDFLTPERLHEPETHFPLRVVECDACRLLQLDYTVDRSTLYSPDYPYLSSTTITGRAHYHGMASRIVHRFSTWGELAVDIGSNVGVLLGGFRQQGSMRVLGIEPVPPTARMANLAGIDTISSFFSSDLATDIVKSRGRAFVITGTNVVADIHDLHQSSEFPSSEEIVRHFLFDFEKLGPVANQFSRIGDGNDHGSPGDASSSHAKQRRGRAGKPNRFGSNELGEFLLLPIFQDNKFPGLLIVGGGGFIGRMEQKIEIMV